MMDIDIDIEGDDVPCVYISSSVSLHAPRTPPQLASPASLAVTLVPHLHAPHIHPDLKVFIPDIHDARHRAQAPRGPRCRCLPRGANARYGAACGVCAVERVRGSGGWSGAVLDRAELLDASRGFAGYAGEEGFGWAKGPCAQEWAWVRWGGDRVWGCVSKHEDDYGCGRVWVERQRQGRAIRTPSSSVRVGGISCSRDRRMVLAGGTRRKIGT
ncbi:hypothetical protein B0H17DRAFT_511378 [Mycena rosella]|uniref:Uncharacterized protein n=1 Tax=Mycena rosella TaxID=1033263 RepID=A0AAD7BY23_MYCRO|nr:hypothetical protein B0H17DRAFT_511378 [Mycena rosella]